MCSIHILFLKQKIYEKNDQQVNKPGSCIQELHTLGVSQNFLSRYKTFNQQQLNEMDQKVNLTKNKIKNIYAFKIE